MYLNSNNKKALKNILMIINYYLICNNYLGKLLIEVFNFSFYPFHFSISNYTWKQVMIYDTLIKYKRMVFWFDAGVELTGSVKYEIIYAKKYDFYMESNFAKILKWTPNKTTDTLHINRSMLIGKSDGDIGYLFINYNNYMIENIIKEWVKCAYNPMCICPPGSSRKNSRYDQVTFTLLLYTNEKYKNLVGKFRSFNNHKKQCDHRSDCNIKKNYQIFKNYIINCKN